MRESPQSREKDTAGTDLRSPLPTQGRQPTGSGGTGSSGTGSSEAVAELLGDMGFEPEPVAGGIALRNCPFREIVDDNQPVVCAIHEGMLDGMLEQPPEGSTTRRGIALEPFAAPEGCLVRLDPQGYER